MNDFWAENVSRERNDSHKIIYAGTFVRRKKLDVLIDCIKKIREEPKYSDLTLTVVGGDNDKGQYMHKIIDKNSGFVHFLGKISDKAELMNIYREHSVFAMPSVHETFGLVYIEALSQNLALLYTKNEGVDGFFDSSAGVTVDANSSEEIIAALKKLLDDRDSFSNANVDFDNFRWGKLAERYHRIYSDIVSTKE